MSANRNRRKTEKKIKGKLSTKLSEIQYAIHKNYVLVMVNLRIKIPK